MYTIKYRVNKVRISQLLQGFTLIELLIVIALISILIIMGVASYTNSQRQGRNARKIQDMKAIQQALESSYSVNGVYPNSCIPGVEYLSQGIPLNPSTQVAYAAVSCSVPNSTYCYCVQLEPATSTAGNSTAGTCANYGAGSWYCVNQLQ